MEPRDLLAVMAEPSRMRIVELLAASPRTVGEIAQALGALQPQTTKHVQALESAGLVTVYRLGRRKVVALERDAVRGIAGWLDGLSVAHPSEPVLEQYRRAIEAERERGAGDLAVHIRRDLAAPPTAVWHAWTDPAIVRRWWSPQHFEVGDCVVEPVIGGRLEIELVEGDGARYRSAGEFLAVVPARELAFTLAPLGPDGAPLFDPRFVVTFTPIASGTAVDLTVTVRDATPATAPMVAGLEPGWNQLLDKLADVIA